MAEVAALANKVVRLLLLYSRNFLTNLYRRLLILAKRVGIFWQKRRWRKLCGKMGAEIYAKYTAGDVNPLLQEGVKDLLAAIQAQDNAIELRRQAIQEIREQIKNTSYRLAEQPPIPTEPATAEEPASEEKQP